MSVPINSEIAPLFEAYGAACYEAQHFEGGIRFLLILIKECEKDNINISKYAKSCMNMDASKRTLGDLFKTVQEKEYFTDAEKKIINKAIRERNHLIHSYWNKNINRAITPQGREWVIQNLDDLKEYIRSSTAIVNSIIDRHLQEYGLNVEYFVDRANDEWESDSPISIDLLH